MNILDIIIAIPLIYGLIRGLFKGFIAELTSLLSLFLGVILAFYLSDDLYAYLAPQVENPGIGLRVLCYVIIFMAVAAVMYFISKSLTKVLNFMALGIVNHLLGGAFGLLKFAFIMAISVHFLAPIQKSQRLVQQETINQSRLFRYFYSYDELISGYRKDLFENKGEEFDINRGATDELEEPIDEIPEQP